VRPRSNSATNRSAGVVAEGVVETGAEPGWVGWEAVPEVTGPLSPSVHRRTNPVPTRRL
jgi:hypothetical protein